MKTTLLIMAAGIGSRYGGGIKQLALVDDRNHILMDYSIHDAIAAGFDRIVFVIRRDIEADFRAIIGSRIEAVCAKAGVEVAYAFQSLEDLPQGAQVPEGRKKPWGTGQAVLAARELIREPFAAINADDYYGREAYRKLHDFLVSETREDRACMVGFILKNTLSDNGGVTRGICQVSPEGLLTEVVETKNILKTPSGAEACGKALDLEAVVSMNMWGFHPGFMQTLVEGFREFFQKEVPADPMKAEFLIPVYVARLLQAGKLSVSVLPTPDKWFGVTYQEDKALVVETVKDLIARGIYQADLYSDL